LTAFEKATDGGMDVEPTGTWPLTTAMVACAGKARDSMVKRARNKRLKKNLHL